MTNLKTVRNKILDDISSKKRVLTYDEYAEFCTRRQFSGQVRYISKMLDIRASFFHRDNYLISSGAYRVFY
ncbi:hypothetical protein ACTXMF_10675 [Psychrobacter celer]|uniref:hypothetical protein n=1 Tax=Psychrobacter celer TaxID=306572 RepID=UPI003FD63A47